MNMGVANSLLTPIPPGQRGAIPARRPFRHGLPTPASWKQCHSVPKQRRRGDWSLWSSKHLSRFFWLIAASIISDRVNKTTSGNAALAIFGIVIAGRATYAAFTNKFIS